jgi:hypothetical protein
LAHKDNALTLPASAVSFANGRPTVTILNDKNKEEKVEIETGVVTNKLVEIVSGLTEDSKVVVKSKKIDMGSTSAGKNPFMPSFGKPKSGGGH